MVTRMNILSPSILAADFFRLGEQIREVERAGAPYLHFDVMDGMFVPSISFGLPVLKTVRRGTNLFLDVHLMIMHPERYIRQFAECGADLINFHLEATDQVGETIAAIRAEGKKVGITIKPETPAEAVRPWLADVDMVLVMTVEPGSGGQPLIPACLEKVCAIRDMALKEGLSPDIEVDGGVKPEKVEEVLKAGANVIVAGSSVFEGDVYANVTAFLDEMKKGEKHGA